MVGAAILAAVDGGVWTFFAPRDRSGRMGKPQGGLLEAGAGAMAATVVVGLIGALVAEAPGSIAGRQLYRNRCVPQEAR